jgi:hypothetical protein
MAEQLDDAVTAGDGAERATGNDRSGPEVERDG